ncbi:MAG TPA: hypothetical protein VF183_13210 [Acidimicrobiales bacterium]
MTATRKTKEMCRRIALCLLVAAVPVLTIGTSHGAWVDEVRVEAKVTFASTTTQPDSTVELPPTTE